MAKSIKFSKGKSLMPSFDVSINDSDSVNHKEIGLIPFINKNLDIQKLDSVTFCGFNFTHSETLKLSAALPCEVLLHG